MMILRQEKPTFRNYPYTGDGYVLTEIYNPTLRCNRFAYIFRSVGIFDHVFRYHSIGCYSIKRIDIASTELFIQELSGHDDT